VRVSGLPETQLFQSTPSGRKATVLACHSLGHYKVSIHAFREEGDIMT